MCGAWLQGSAVRLGPIAEDGVLGVGEGVESVLAASLIHGVPTWACLTAGNLAEFEPPGAVRKIVVFGDNDATFTGQEAAYPRALDLVERIPARSRPTPSPRRPCILRT